MTRRRRHANRLWLLLVSGCLVTGADAAERVRFNRDVLSILAENCFTCHGFDNAKREAGLRLDQRAGSLKELASGATAIVPGNVARSALWTRVTTADEEQRMPPPETGLK